MKNLIQRPPNGRRDNRLQQIVHHNEPSIMVVHGEASSCNSL
jgi:hypothetical protein